LTYGEIEEGESECSAQLPEGFGREWLDSGCRALGKEGWSIVDGREK